MQETLKLYGEIERLTSNYVEQQVALRADLLEIQTRVAKTEQEELTLENQRASAKEQLNQMLGRDVLTNFDVEAVMTAAELEVDLEAARKLALEQRPEVCQAHLRREQAQWDLRAKKAESIPDLAIEYNAIRLLNFSTFLPTQLHSVGLSLTWEPFDWGRKKSEAAEKQHTVEQADNAAAAASLVVIDVIQNYRQLQQSRAQLRVASLTQQTAIENLRVAKNKYAVEGVLLKDVLQAAKFSDIRRPAPPTMYLPFLQHPQRSMTFAVRAVGDPETLISSLRQSSGEHRPKPAVVSGAHAG